MKKDRNEIIKYYSEMPSTFERPNNEGIVDLAIDEVLSEKSLQLIPSGVGAGSAICTDIDGNQYLVKRVNTTEKVMYTAVLPSIIRQSLPFKILQFPELANIVTKKQQNFLFIKHIDGTKFNDVWDEISDVGSGGKGINADFSNKVVDLVEDLSLIKPLQLEEFDLSTFDFEKWKSTNLPFISEILVKRGLITQDLVDKTASILASNSLFANSRMIITNGDFYPRNLIETPDEKVAIIDWEGRKDYDIDGLVDQRNAFFNYIENHLAFFLIHMWGNSSFQRNLIKVAAERFGLTAENLQAAILIRSLEQSMIWPDDLARHQTELFISALDIDFIKKLIL